MKFENVGATIGRQFAERAFTVFLHYAGGRPMVSPAFDLSAEEDFSLFLFTFNLLSLTKNECNDNIKLRKQSEVAMGTTLSSIHIYNSDITSVCGFNFKSFSENWLTCIDDFSERDPEYPIRAAKLISKNVDSPVLSFYEFDSEMIQLIIFVKGKIAARYSDHVFETNKKLFDIPALVGYEDGHKRRFSSILGCPDTDLKIQLLEEFLGVCLEFSPELLDEPEALVRKKDTEVYLKFREEEKKLSGKSAPYELKKIDEFTGKLFWNRFGDMGKQLKEHLFFFGYTEENDYNRSLTPVIFKGTGFTKLSNKELDNSWTDKHPYDVIEEQFFKIDYFPTKVTFKSACPESFRSKTITLPEGYYPENFTSDGMLILKANSRLCIMDETFKIVAKLSIKGEIADILGDYILTTTGDSFCGYCYNPRAKIYIYEIMKKN